MLAACARVWLCRLLQACSFSASCHSWARQRHLRIKDPNQEEALKHRNRKRYQVASARRKAPPRTPQFEQYLKSSKSAGTCCSNSNLTEGLKRVAFEPG